MPLIYLAIAWMVGIYVSSQVSAQLGMWLLALPLPLSICLLWRRNRRVRLGALCALFLLLGAARYVMARPHLAPGSISAYNDQGWCTLVGTVVAEPDVRDADTLLRVQAQALHLPDRPPTEVEGTVLVYAPQYPEWRYGDQLEVSGLLETPPVLEGFSYRDYLARQGIHSLVRRARVVLLERGRGNRALALLLALKWRLGRVIAAILPEPAASLLAGILLGVDSGLPGDLVADFRATGTSHIIAISGFNISLISGLLTSLSVRLVGRRYAAWFSSAAIALYTLFVGASAAVVRAALMGAVAIWGRHIGRKNVVPNALFASALLMTAWNPHTLWDVGFELSFAATLGLVLFADPFQDRLLQTLARLLPGGWVEALGRPLNEGVVFTVCAEVTTLPIILSSFGTLSLVTLLANLLILPVQAQVMLWGGMATVGGLIWTPLGHVLGWVAGLFLRYTIWVVEAAANVPHTSIELGRVAPLLIVAWYGCVGLVGWYLAQTEEARRRVWEAVRGALTAHLSTKALIGGLSIGAVLVWWAVASLPDGKLHVTVLDVGDGSAALIESPTGDQVLVNGGRSPTRLRAHLGRRMPFWDRTLELVVLTDLEEGHVAGLVPALERYRVGTALQAHFQGGDSATFQAWQERVQEQGPILEPGLAPTRVDLGSGIVLTVLHPTGEELESAPSGPDRHGMVVRLDYGGTCFLYVGGVGESGQAAMLARGEDLRCQVVQVDGGRGTAAVSAAFLEAVRPDVVIISCATGDGVDPCAQETAERAVQVGATVLRTAEVGSVEWVSDGRQYQIRLGR